MTVGVLGISDIRLRSFVFEYIGPLLHTDAIVVDGVETAQVLSLLLVQTQHVQLQPSIPFLVTILTNPIVHENLTVLDLLNQGVLLLVVSVIVKAESIVHTFLLLDTVHQQVVLIHYPLQLILSIATVQVS